MRGAVFHLSKYTYKADSLFDERDCLSVHSDTFTENWVAQTITSLSSNQELAIHSNVIIKGRTWHIPMIDFAAEMEISRQTIDRLRQFLPRSVFLNMAFFASGRSFHAYSTALLSPKEWHGFMGRLLLITPARGTELIDSRWVGHRLIGGFCSLRWSNNSGLYRGEPRLITMHK
jgi:hypothetical protein